MKMKVFILACGSFWLGLLHSGQYWLSDDVMLIIMQLYWFNTCVCVMNVRLSEKNHDNKASCSRLSCASNYWIILVFNSLQVKYCHVFGFISVLLDNSQWIFHLLPSAWQQQVTSKESWSFPTVTVDWAVRMVLSSRWPHADFVETDMGSDDSDRLWTLWKPKWNHMFSPSSTRLKPNKEWKSAGEREMRTIVSCQTVR